MEIKIAGNDVKPNMLVTEILQFMHEKQAVRLYIYLDGLRIDYVHYTELIDFVNEKINGQSLRTHKLNFDIESALIAIRNQRIEKALFGQYKKYDRNHEVRSLHKIRLSCMVADAFLLAGIAGYFILKS